MTTALVCGAGLVGRRVARQLADSDEIGHVRVADRRGRRAEAVVGALGGESSAMRWPLTSLEGVDVVVSALAGDHDVDVARRAIDACVPCVSVADSPSTIAGLRGLDGPAREAGTTVAIGAGFSPGLTEVLATHAATLFDEVEEVRLARAGWSGPASAASVRRTRRDVAALWRGGKWHEVSKREEQVWFPEPIGPVDCEAVRAPAEVMVGAIPNLAALTATLADAERPRRRHARADALGAIRVEVWGTRKGGRDVVVYGAIDRVSIAAGAVAAIAAIRLVDRARPTPAGVHGVAALVDPLAAMADLSARGVRSAVFEGAPIS
jgi:hypothetical protein